MLGAAVAEEALPAIPSRYYDFSPATFNAQADNSAVTSWPTSGDSTGTGFTATISGSPVLRKSALNGYSVVEFPAAGRTLLGRRPWADDEDFGMVLVYKLSTNGTKTLLNFGNSDSSEYCGYFIHLATSELHVTVTSVGEYNSPETLDTYGDWHILVITRGTTGGLRIRIDDQPVTYSVAVPEINAFDLSFPYSYLGDSGQVVQIAAVATFNAALSNDDMTDAFDHYAAKFDLV